MNLVVKENLSFRIATSPNLQKILEIMSKRKVIMPSSRYFMKTLGAKFNLMKSKMKCVLNEQEFVCVTCDVWTCRAQSYIGMTVHFLTDNFERKSSVLSFRQMKGRQTNKELSTEMASVLHEFNLPKSKVTNIVTDGCSAFTKGFRLFGTCDRVTQSEIEDIPNEDIEPSDCDETDFMQNEDGEFFVTNEINLQTNDEIYNNVSSEDETNDGIDIEQQILLDGLVPTNRNDSETANNLNTIELPEQRRCVSHQLNLGSQDFEKNLSSGPKLVLVNAINKLQQLWVRTHRNSMAKTICKEVYFLMSSVLIVANY